MAHRRPPQTIRSRLTTWKAGGDTRGVSAFPRGSRSGNTTLIDFLTSVKGNRATKAHFRPWLASVTLGSKVTEAKHLIIRAPTIIGRPNNAKGRNHALVVRCTKLEPSLAKRSQPGFRRHSLRGFCPASKHSSLHRSRLATESISFSEIVNSPVSTAEMSKLGVGRRAKGPEDLPG